jgi:hypothetical protein
MIRLACVSLFALASVAGVSVAQGPPPGWFELDSAEFGAVYGRQGSDTDLLLDFNMGSAVSASAASASELTSMLTEAGQCGNFGRVRADGGGAKVWRAETLGQTDLPCSLVLAEGKRGATLVFVAKTIAPDGDLSTARNGAETLLALRTGRATSVTATPAPKGPAMTVSEDALKAALAAIPKANVPARVITHGTSSYSGWPPSYVYIVTTHLYFANGWMTDCSNWDPGVLSPTPESLGEARPDCTLARWRKTARGAEVQNEDGTWSGVELNDGTVQAFSAGQRLNLAFGNVGGAGFSGPGVAVNINTISGSDLQMTQGGEIAVGEWSTTVLSGSNIGGGGSRSSEPLVGRYRVDGNLIAVGRPDGTITRGFIAGVNEGRNLGHVYLNGRHFWNRDD